MDYSCSAQRKKVILPVAQIEKRQRILLDFNLSAGAQEEGVS